VRSEGFYVNEKPLTPAGIEPATFRFVAQYLNHCATAVPPLNSNCSKSLEDLYVIPKKLNHSGLELRQDGRIMRQHVQ